MLGLAQKVITGVVISSQDKLPVIGASVIVKGNGKIGVSTDLDGKFKLTVPESAKLLKVSFMGMKSVEVPIQSKMHIVLDPDSRELDAVVVVGMTKVDKRLFTGASTQVSGDKAKLDGVPDAARALEGRAAGVSVQNVSATFGSAPKIRVRGATSIFGSSKPLWVVDGVVLDDVVSVGPDDLASGDAATLISSAIAGLNADDIASFQVLKDGSATSIYGARAMAGVIVVNTKKGSAGHSKISYTGEYTYRMIPSYRNYNIMNSQQQMSVYRELENKGWLNLSDVSNASSSGIYGDLYKRINEGTLINDESHRNAFLRDAEYRNTDWFQELFRNSVMNNHSVSITSGNDKVSYYASLSALVDPGWTLQSNVKRYTANLNTTYKISPKLSFNMIANASYRQQRAPGTLSQDVDVVNGEVKRDFDINPFSYAINTSRVLDPNVAYTRNYSPFNIKKELANNYLDFNIYDLKFQSELKYKLFKNFELSVLGDVKYNSTKNEHIITERSNQAMAYRAMQTTTILNKNPYMYRDPDRPLDLPITVLPKGGFYNIQEYGLKAWDFRATGQYNDSFADDHIVSVFGGMEVNAIDRQASSFDGWGMQYEEGESVYFDYNAFKKMKEDGGVYYSLSHSRYRNVAFFANATYSYKAKYTLNGTLRYEGTNKMGRSLKSRWLPTWNISGSWNVSRESWFDPAREYVSNLLLKASYSLTADKGPDWVNNSTVIIKGGTQWRNPASVQEPGYFVDSPENANLTYEKKHEFNVGTEVGFLDDRINLSLDWYRRDNFDLIAPMVTQGLNGSTLQYGNAASMKSQGLELSLSTTNLKTKDFSWTTDFIYAHSTNEITDLYANGRIIDMVRSQGFAKVGYPVRSVFSIPFAGLTSEGYPSFKGPDGNITVGDIDFQVRGKETDFLKYEGSADPTDFGSLGNTFTYKGFSLNLFLTYSMGNVIRLDPVFASSYSDLSSMPREFDNRWIKAGDEKITNVPVIPSAHENYLTGFLNRAYNSYNFSDVRVAKGDFVRLKEISLAYEFPKKMIETLGLSNMNLKIQATNLMLIYSDSALNGADPEFFNVGGVASPLPHQITATLRIGI